MILGTVNALARALASYLNTRDRETNRRLYNESLKKEEEIQQQYIDATRNGASSESCDIIIGRLRDIAAIRGSDQARVIAECRGEAGSGDD